MIENQFCWLRINSWIFGVVIAANIGIAKFSDFGFKKPTYFKGFIIITCHQCHHELGMKYKTILLQSRSWRPD